MASPPGRRLAAQAVRHRGRILVLAENDATQKRLRGQGAVEVRRLPQRLPATVHKLPLGHSPVTTDYFSTSTRRRRALTATQQSLPCCSRTRAWQIHARHWTAPRSQRRLAPDRPLRVHDARQAVPPVPPLPMPLPAVPGLIEGPAFMGWPPGMLSHKVANNVLSDGNPTVQSGHRLHDPEAAVRSPSPSLCRSSRFLFAMSAHTEASTSTYPPPHLARRSTRFRCILVFTAKSRRSRIRRPRNRGRHRGPRPPCANSKDSNWPPEP